MASKDVTPIALLLSLNLLFFTLVSSTYYPSPPQPEDYEPTYPTSPPPQLETYEPSYPISPSPQPEDYEPNYPISSSPQPEDYEPNYPISPPLSEGYEPSYPTYPPPSESYEPNYPNYPAKCPRDTLKLGVCVDLLKDLVSVTVGTPPKTPCCSLIGDLVDLEAAVCLCTTIKASLLGINLSVPIDLSLLLNYCGKQVPEGFTCA